MTILTSVLRDLTKHFNDEGYPSDVYYHLLNRVRNALSPAEMGDALSHALAWKDGKIRLDPRGAFIALPASVRYNVATAKPNTLSERHRELLRSNDFFIWADEVRKVEYFEIGLLIRLTSFGLWNNTVIPVFVLHCLNPRIYPIIDRWVVLAYRLLSSDFDKQSKEVIKISPDLYAAYQAWWLEMLAEKNLAPMSAQLGQLKELDAGLRAFGKRANALLKAWATEHVDEAEQHNEETRLSPGSAKPAIGTDSEDFKRLAVVNWTAGRTQLQAIQAAGEELGIQLKPSYTKYPGSHFDRWKKQGIF